MVKAYVHVTQAALVSSVRTKFDRVMLIEEEMRTVILILMPTYVQTVAQVFHCKMVHALVAISDVSLVN